MLVEGFRKSPVDATIKTNTTKENKGKSRIKTKVGSMVIAGSVVLTGCFDDGSKTESPPPTSFCEILQQLGDSDCDYILDVHDKHPGANDLTYDTDFDGVPDSVDLYFGDDYGDADGDGYANWLDRAPLNPRITVYAIPSSDDLKAQQQSDIDKSAARIKANNRIAANDNRVNEELKRESDAAKKDSDNDGTPDRYDALPYLDNFADFDGDGIPNGSDQFPYTKGWN